MRFLHPAGFQLSVSSKNPPDAAIQLNVAACIDPALAINVNNATETTAVMRQEAWTARRSPR